MHDGGLEHARTCAHVRVEVGQAEGWKRPEHELPASACAAPGEDRPGRDWAKQGRGQAGNGPGSGGASFRGRCLTASVCSTHERAHAVRSAHKSGKVCTAHQAQAGASDHAPGLPGLQTGTSPPCRRQSC